MTDVAKVDADPTKWSTGPGSPRLQKPDWVFFAGEVRPWEDAVLHVSAEAVVRGLNVFEGLKGYWQEDALRSSTSERHYARLCRSASLLYIPVTFSYDEFESACFDLTRALYQPEKDSTSEPRSLWWRATTERARSQISSSRGTCRRRRRQNRSPWA